MLSLRPHISSPSCTLNKSFNICLFTDKTGTKNIFSQGILVDGVSEPKERDEGIHGEWFSSGDGILITYMRTDQVSICMKNYENGFLSQKGVTNMGREKDEINCCF